MAGKRSTVLLAHERLRSGGTCFSGSVRRDPPLRPRVLPPRVRRRPHEVAAPVTTSGPPAACPETPLPGPAPPDQEDEDGQRSGVRGTSGKSRDHSLARAWKSDVMPRSQAPAPGACILGSVARARNARIRRSTLSRFR